MRVLIAVLVVSLSAGFSSAGPTEMSQRVDRDRDAYTEFREASKQEYEEAREARRKAMDLAARASHASPKNEVPGWKSEKDLATSTEESSPEGAPPPARVSTGAVIILLVAGGVVLNLMRRVFFPRFALISLLRRRGSRPSVPNGRPRSGAKPPPGTRRRAPKKITFCPRNERVPGSARD